MIEAHHPHCHPLVLYAQASGNSQQVSDNAFTSHLMLDSDEVYQMTKRGLDAAQIAAAKGIHLNLVLVKLLELHHLAVRICRHYHAQHHAFIKQFNLPRHIFELMTLQIKLCASP